MYGLSREASVVHEDSNNEDRGVSRGRSSRSRAEQGEGPNNSQRQSRMYVPTSLLTSGNGQDVNAIDRIELSTQSSEAKLRKRKDETNRT